MWLVALVLAFGTGWIGWYSYKTGVVHNRGVRYTRKDDPFNYWLTMVSIVVAIAGLVGIAVWSTL